MSLPPSSTEHGLPIAMRYDCRVPAQSPTTRVSPVSILLTLFESRSVTLAHVVDLHFSGRFEAAKMALRRLKDAGHAASRPGPKGAHVFSITLAGIDALSARGALEPYPPLTRRQQAKRASGSDRTLLHELSVLDVKAAFSRSLGRSLSEFGTWPELFRFEAALPGEPLRYVQPDGFMRLRSAGRHDSCFLEVDRSTESLGVFVRRLRRYAVFHRAGGFAERCGGGRHEVAAYPFRVLVVLESEERRNNLAEALARAFPPVLTLVWLAIKGEVLADPLSACWVCPVDYRDAVAAMPPPRRGRGEWYRRDRAREARIAALIRKRALAERSQEKGGPVAA